VGRLGGQLIGGHPPGRGRAGSAVAEARRSAPVTALTGHCDRALP